MTLKELGIESGKWLVANCGRFPSESNCHLVIMGPPSQRADLLEACVAHAVQHHGHEDTSELRQQLDQFFEEVAT